MTTEQSPTPAASAPAPINNNNNDNFNVDWAVVREIVDHPGPFATAEEQATCRRMVVEALTAEEQEVAACTSYAYWILKTTSMPTTTTSDDTSNPDNESTRDERRIRSAMKEARRHLVGEKGDYQNALTNLRTTCQFRKERKLDLLRLCFATDAQKSHLESKDDIELLSRWESMLEKEMGRQAMVVRGCDRQRRAIIHRLPRLTVAGDEADYSLLFLYIAERAFAITEMLSKGNEEKIVVIFDCANYQSSIAAPTSYIQNAVVMLQKIYPERAGKIFILDPPFWVKAIFYVVYAFIAKDTQEKIRVVSGVAEKSREIGLVVDAEQATPSMLPDGKLKTALDIKQALRKTAFHLLYEEE